MESGPARAQARSFWIERAAESFEMTTYHFDSYSGVLESYLRALRIVLIARRIVFEGTSNRINRTSNRIRGHFESY
jgi:hypothetical protein